MGRRAKIPLPLAGFGLELLSEQAERCELGLEAFVAQAAKRYVSRADPRRPSQRVPRFVKGSEPRAGETQIEIELEPDVLSALERHAGEQGVKLELLVMHAALWHAATLDGA